MNTPRRRRTASADDGLIRPLLFAWPRRRRREVLKLLDLASGKAARTGVAGFKERVSRGRLRGGDEVGVGDRGVDVRGDVKPLEGGVEVG